MRRKVQTKVLHSPLAENFIFKYVIVVVRPTHGVTSLSMGMERRLTRRRVPIGDALENKSESRGADNLMSYMISP